MTDLETTFGLNPQQIASLLKLGTQQSTAGDSSPGDQEKSDLLRDRLARRLCCDDTATRNLVEKTISEAMEKPLQDQILSRETSVAVLRSIKAYGARLSRHAQSEAERQTANVIYYAAIAGALAEHALKITELSVQDLAESFSALERLPWLTSGIAELFHHALEVCQASPASISEGEAS